MFERHRVRAAVGCLLGERADLATGHVYFVQGEGGGLIKIGWALHSEVAAPAHDRLRTLQACSPVRLVILATYPATPQAERALHGVFGDDRQHGEWFAPTADLLYLIETLQDPEAVAAAWDEMLDDARLELEAMS